MEIVYTSIEQLNGKMKCQITGSVAQAQKALLRIYANQTIDEQRVGMTTKYNGIGFTGSDSQILSFFAKQLKKFGRLSDKQNAILMKKIGKYAGQLVKMSIADQKIVKIGNEYKVNPLGNK